MLAAGYVDPWTVHAPSDDLIVGPPVALDKGDGIARPQTVAEPVPGHPGSPASGPSPRRPGSRWSSSPATARPPARSRSIPGWRQPSRRARGCARGRGAEPAVVPLSPAVPGRDPAHVACRDGAIRPEASRPRILDPRLRTGRVVGDDRRNLRRHLQPVRPALSIFPIRKDTAFYAPASYHDPGVSYLAVHRFRGEVPPTQFGEVIAPGAPGSRGRNAGVLVARFTGLADRLLQRRLPRRCDGRSAAYPLGTHRGRRGGRRGAGGAGEMRRPATVRR